MGAGRPEEAPPRNRGGGGGGPVARGGVEQVGEHRGEARKLAAGDVGHEGGRRGELRGELGGGGGHGGQRWPFQAKGGARSWLTRSGRKERGVRALWSSRDGSRRVKARGRA